MSRALQIVQYSSTRGFFPVTTPEGPVMAVRYAAFSGPPLICSSWYDYMVTSARVSWQSAPAPEGPMMAVRRAAFRPPLTPASTRAPFRPRSFRPRPWNSTSNRGLLGNMSTLFSWLSKLIVVEVRQHVRPFPAPQASGAVPGTPPPAAGCTTDDERLSRLQRVLQEDKAVWIGVFWWLLAALLARPPLTPASTCASFRLCSFKSRPWNFTSCCSLHRYSQSVQKKAIFRVL